MKLSFFLSERKENSPLRRAPVGLDPEVPYPKVTIKTFAVAAEFGSFL